MVSRNRIIDQLDRLEPGLARAFREAVNRIRDRARLGRLADAIEAGDLDAAIRAAGIRSAAVWTPLTEATRDAFIQGAESFAATAPASVNFAFDVNNPRAERWLRENSSRLVTRISDDQRESIRIAVSAGTARGANPRNTALDIVGRLNRRSGRRDGGIVGLTSSQARAVEAARDELRNPEMMANYFTRKRRDRRFDSIVRRAMEEGKPVAAADIRRMTGRYSDRLLELRGQAIARTETLNAFNGGRQESLQQAVDEGLIRPDNIQRVWVDASDGRVRDQHAAADGQVVGMDEPFIVGGERLMYPGDPRTASAGNVIQCRCIARENVDWIAEEAA